MADIIDAATAIFNPFVAVLGLAIGVTLGGRLLRMVARMF